MRIQQVAIAAIKKENKYLLTKRVKMDPEDVDYAPFVWHLPGGGIEKDENSETALKREIKEELGVEIHSAILIPKTFTDTRRNWQGVFILFLCSLMDYNQEIILNEESEEYGWFTLEEASKLKVLPHTIEMIVEANKLRI
ncbi:NUDIX hydrolase [Candidatus Roizmanbacteria bacterium]|nr:NUDIX hydrolase [Candidatus Roizmanbacteria bacterium]